MAGLAPGDPQLVSMIVNHLKTQGLFDQFRRDCLADVDTKPAYLNLKQRVDNFVSNHLSNHTWSPHLNKNQLRNNIRQLVLQSGMLEQGVDRIVAQVVDPKINHIFRPQVERVVREFLSPGSCSEEPPLPLAPAEMKPDGIILEQGSEASSSTPATSSAPNAMSILDTITSLNQEASSRATPSGDIEEGSDINSDEKMTDEAEEAKLASEFQVLDVKVEEAEEQMVSAKEGLMEEVEKETSGGQEQVDDAKDKAGSKNSGKQTEDRLEDEPLKPSCQIKQKTRERLKEEYSLEDSDLDGLSDITVSSVHTSDLSSFEEESDEDQPPSDSSEDRELSDAEKEEGKQGTADTEDDKERKPRRKAYVHKPFLYSRYYSDSDDEVTVEERRRSAAKDKEERLLKRQQNRERWEEKRRQKAALVEEQDARRRLRDSPSLEGPRAKEARKERKVLEKKMALKRKLDSRKEGNVSSKRKGDSGGESAKKGEVKPSSSKASQAKPIRRMSESVLSDERHRKCGNISEDSSETKKLPDKSRAHSFILELEQGSQESLKHRSIGKFDRLPRKELHSKERKEKERSLSDDRTKLKPKMEKRAESQADETQQKEGVGVKVSSDEKGEKRPKVKSEKKMLGTTREGRVSEGVADEGASREATSKKSKTPAVEAAKADKEKVKDKPRDKDKEKVKEKSKGEKTLGRYYMGKSDAKQLIRPDSAGSSEDRSDMELVSDSSKKGEKHPKEVVKKVKSHTDDKQVEKPKSKSDTKDGEREKTKAELDSQKLNKASSETEKDPRKTKPTEKGKAVEKSKLKSKEEVKTAMSTKTDQKIQSLEGKSKRVATVVKHELQTKEKKKEGSAKEHRRTPEDTPQDKLESRSAKKRLEKDNISEKKEESLEEKKAYKEDKNDKSERSLTPSVSSPCPESEEPPKKRALLQDASTDSEPTATTIVTSVSEDTYDALSDITPEPDDGETELRHGELETRPMPPEADALLTLMDICTSADARLVHDVCQEVAAPEVKAPELTLYDADMKMKEAALTLLSMDPDSTLSPSLIPVNPREDGEVNSPPPMDTATPGKAEPNVTEIVQMEADNDQKTTTLPPALSQEVDKPVTGETDSADTPDVVERETDVPQVHTSGSIAPVDDITTSNEQQAQLTEEKAVESEVQPVEEPPADVQDEIQSNVAAVKTATQVEQMEDESNQAKMDVEDEDNQAKIDADNKNEDHNVTKLEENVAQEKRDPQNVECDDPNNPGEVRETRRSRQTKLIKQTSSASDSDRQEDEKGSGLSEKEGRTEGRVTRKRKLPSTTTNSGEDEDKKAGQEEPSAEETEQEKVAEAKTPRRGRSSKSTTEEEEQPKETEMSEEMPTHSGTQAGAQAKDTADGQSPLVSQPQPGDEEEQSTENKTDQVEGDEQPQEEQETAKRKPGRRGRPSKGDAGVATEDSGEDGDKNVSQEEPSAEETEQENVAEAKTPRRGRSSKTTTDEEEQRGGQSSKPTTEEEEQPKETEMSEEMPTCSVTQAGAQAKDTADSQSPLVSQAQPGDEEEQSTENKTDQVEGDEQTQEEQETAKKKPGRRGRPSKGAAGVATEDSADTKDKEKEQNEEEEDDDTTEEDTKSRTTRSAARLEAERNKPSKPSTRASKQGSKEESTRGARGQTAASKGGRKREPSPPAVRTRGGQKSDEPPAKRANR